MFTVCFRFSFSPYQIKLSRSLDDGDDDDGDDDDGDDDGDKSQKKLAAAK